MGDAEVTVALSALGHKIAARAIVASEDHEVMRRRLAPPPPVASRRAGMSTRTICGATICRRSLRGESDRLIFRSDGYHHERTQGCNVTVTDITSDCHSNSWRTRCCSPHNHGVICSFQRFPDRLPIAASCNSCAHRIIEQRCANDHQVWRTSTLRIDGKFISPGAAGRCCRSRNRWCGGDVAKIKRWIASR